MDTLKALIAHDSDGYVICAPELNGGPIMWDENLDEAKRMFKEALAVCFFVNFVEKRKKGFNIADIEKMPNNIQFRKIAQPHN